MAVWLCRKSNTTPDSSRQNAKIAQQYQDELPAIERPAPAHTGRGVLIWIAFILGSVLVISCLWLLMKTPGVALADDPETALDCIKCHQQTLSWHDKLGTGSQACWACHDSTDQTMTKFKLANGTTIEKSDVSQLCGQCHQVRYNAWQEGTHGIPGTVATVPCTICHSPHQPQVTFTNITKPPLTASRASPLIPKDALIITGISILFLIVLGIVLARRRETL